MGSLLPYIDLASLLAALCCGDLVNEDVKVALVIGLCSLLS